MNKKSIQIYSDKILLLFLNLFSFWCGIIRLKSVFDAASIWGGQNPNTSFLMHASKTKDLVFDVATENKALRYINFQNTKYITLYSGWEKERILDHDY